jgi:hypothetical protein
MVRAGPRPNLATAEFALTGGDRDMMIRFDDEQAAAYAQVQQLVNAWARDLDLNHGANIGELVTEDVSYAVTNPPAQGRAAVQKFYAERHARIAAYPTPPTARHLNSNLVADAISASEARITFNLLFFSSEATGSLNPDILAVADVRMTCRRDADGAWRIAKFESNQPLKRS